MSFTDGEIYVSYDHMQNAADDMVSQTKAIHQTLVDLDAELQALRDTWSGIDKDAYSDKQSQWNSAVEAMNNLLVKNAKLLTEVSGNYQYTERKLNEVWSGVKVIG
ncbi:WXG100 family type VII secretion target [Streptomyces sp. NPDC090106]|uniref:WXG100 family type VII secretion target n=1 Tax=Streptomyces sp. NPDC090106 TaxID=3365946 RepID=UPI0038174582